MSVLGALLAESEDGQPSRDGKEQEFSYKERTEGGFNHTNFGGGGINTGESTPIVDDETSTDHIRTSVHRTGLWKVKDQIRQGPPRTTLRQGLTHD